MSTVKILEEKSITIAELRDHLKKIKKRDEELNFRANKTEEFLNSFAEMKTKDAKELYSKFEQLDIQRLKPEHITKIIDVLPSTIEELKVVMQGFTVSLTQENLKKIADLIAPYSEQRK